MCVCVCVCVHGHVCMHACVGACMCAYMYTYVRWLGVGGSAVVCVPCRCAHIHAHAVVTMLSCC